MSVAEPITPPLVAGEKLTREEFLRRWEALPELKQAELIEGVVYLPSPLSIAHGSEHSLVHTWIGNYAARTPGCEALSNPTWFLLEDAPQPDACLRVLPQYRGRSGEERGFGSGPPELIVEVCQSSASYDLGPKLRLYRAAGVQEYLTVQLRERKVIWRRWVDREYIPIESDPRGRLRSMVFPGLWLDPDALLDRNGRRVLEVLNQGLRSAEHKRFVRSLSSRRA